MTVLAIVLAAAFMAGLVYLGRVEERERDEDAARRREP